MSEQENSKPVEIKIVRPELTTFEIMMHNYWGRMVEEMALKLDREIMNDYESCHEIER